MASAVNKSKSVVRSGRRQKAKPMTKAQFKTALP